MVFPSKDRLGPDLNFVISGPAQFLMPRAPEWESPKESGDGHAMLFLACLGVQVPLQPAGSAASLPEQIRPPFLHPSPTKPH